MPPLSRPKTAAMSDLLDRLAGQPREELIACLPRVEAMALELDADALYPETQIVNRVLGRSIRLDDPRQLVGAAILTDLSVIAERVSAQAKLTEAESAARDGSPPISLDELLAKWSISKKSVERYRRSGLIARRLLDEHGRTRLMFSASAVEGFARTHPDRLSRASKFRRVTGTEDERIRSMAARYHRRLRWSLNQCAKRISERRGLSHEGVRQILQRSEAEAGVKIFGEVGPPSARERVMAVHASRRGEAGSPEMLAKRWGRTKASARRAVNEGRADLLRTLDLSGPVLAVFYEREAGRDGGEALLSVPPASMGLGDAGLEDIAELFAAARRRTPPVLAVETARVSALHYLRWRSAQHIAELDSTTASGTVLDRVETDLRWASLIKAELLRPHLGLILETLESRAGGKLEGMGLSAMTRLWTRALGAASHAIDGFDPAGKGRLAGRIGLSVDRAASEMAKHDLGGSAKARRSVPAGARLRDWTLRLDPWQGWLGTDPRVCTVVLGASDRGLTERSRRVLALRLGLPGGGEEPDSAAVPPRTLDEVAAALGTARVHVARFEREAITEALGLWRRTMPR